MKILSNKFEQKRLNRTKQSRLDWLLYLPGAVILSYGLWLSFTSYTGN